MTLENGIVSQEFMEKRRPLVWWYLLLSCFYYFSFVFEGYEFIGYAVFYGVPLVYLCLNYRYLGNLINAFANSWLKYFALVFLAFILATLLVPLFHMTGDYSFLTGNVAGVFKEGLKVTFLIVVFLKHISPEADWRLFIKYFIWVNICYMLCTTLMLLVPSLRDIWLSLVKDGEHGRLEAMNPAYVTRYGWMGFSGFASTLYGTLAVILQCYLISEKRNRITLGDIIPLAALLVATLYYGRIGLLVSACAIAIFFCFYIFLKQPSLAYRTGIIFLSLCLVLGFSYLFSESIRAWLDWAFSVFTNLFTEGHLGDGSTDRLFNDMFFVPSPETMLFGDGRHVDEIGYYMDTDSGLMRPLLFGGLPFAFIRYLLIAILMIAIFSLKKGDRASEKLLISSLLVAFILFEIKGEVVETLIPIVLPFAVVFVIHHLKTTQGELK